MVPISAIEAVHAAASDSLRQSFRCCTCALVDSVVVATINKSNALRFNFTSEPLESSRKVRLPAKAESPLVSLSLMAEPIMGTLLEENEDVVVMGPS